MSKKKKKEKFVDDGRVIANMNVDGMPWYSGPASGDASLRQKPAGTQAPKKSNPYADLYRDEKPSGKETRAVIRGVLAAALLVAGVFAAVMLVFILFCVYVWFA